MKRNFGRGEDAISPVIGVILMVAITVILAAIPRSPVAEITSLWQQGPLTAPNRSSSKLMSDPDDDSKRASQARSAFLFFLSSISGSLVIRECKHFSTY